MANKKKRQPVVSEPDLEPITEAINNRLEEIHSSEAVIADVQHKQSAAGIDPPSEPETPESPSSKYKYTKAGRRIKAEKQSVLEYQASQFKIDFFAAWERHGISPRNGDVLTAYTSNVLDDHGLYTIGINKDNQPYLFLYDHGNSAMMMFTPKSLQQLQWQIDDLLVEVGLNTIGVKSANEHMFRSEPKRK